MKKQLMCNIGMNGFVKEGNKLFFSGFNYNGVFCFDLETKCTKHITYVSECFEDNPFLGRGVRLGDEIFYPPMHGRQLIKFSLMDYSLYKYDIDSEKIGCNSVRFNRMVSNENTLFMVPYMSRAICVFEPQKEVLEYYDVLNGDKEKGIPLFFGNCATSSELWLTADHTNQLFSFNYSNRVINTYPIGDLDNRFGNLCEAKGFLWIMNRTTKTIIKWSKEEGIINEFSLRQYNVDYLSEMVLLDGSIWIATENLSELVEININKEEIRVHNISGEWKRGRGCLSLLNNKICYMPVNSDYMVLVDVETMQIEEYLIRLSEEDEKAYIKNEWEWMHSEHRIYTVDNLDKLLVVM